MAISGSGHPPAAGRGALPEASWRRGLKGSSFNIPKYIAWATDVGSEMGSAHEPVLLAIPIYNSIIL